MGSEKKPVKEFFGKPFEVLNLDGLLTSTGLLSWGTQMCPVHDHRDNAVLHFCYDFLVGSTFSMININTMMKLSGKVPPKRSVSFFKWHFHPIWFNYIQVQKILHKKVHLLWVDALDVNICVTPRFTYWNLITHVLVFGGGLYGRWSGHKDSVLLDRIRMWFYRKEVALSARPSVH